MMFKSIKTGVIAAIMVSSTVYAFAQKKITEGTAVYSMEGAMGKQEQKLSFNNNVSKLVIESGPATISILNDVEKENGLILVSVPIAQIQKAAKLAKKDLTEQNEQQGIFPPVDITPTGEKQTINGFNAEKYTYKNGANGETYEVWITKDIDLPANMFTDNFKSLKGTMVKVTGKGGSIILKSATEGKIGVLSTTDIPSGYDEITYEELKSMQGGGGE
ncbi:DUF4412 domain-containing protein [Pedobacter sp.]|uniref:DUF4412 domain-containing protein n=1 Tax=Pedobacter sp. TaxID=1411316 RepID=UPI00396CF82F